MISGIFLVSLALFLTLTLIKQLRKAVLEKKLPPGPRTLPLIGNLHQLGHLPHVSFQHLSNRHGPLMFLQLGSIPTLVISSAEMAREVFKNHDLVFSSRPALYVAKKFSYDCSGVSFAPYGEYWKEIKKIMILELLSKKRVQAFQTVRDEEVKIMLHSIAISSGPVNLSELTLLLYNNIVCRVAFGNKYEGAADNNASNFHEMLREVQDLLGGIRVADFFTGLWWLSKFNGLESRLEKSFRKMDNFYDKVIKEHLDTQRPEPDHEDLVDVLLRVQKDPNQAIAITIDQIKGVLVDIFLAGTDTSSATVVWTMAELIRNPRVMKKAQDEVRQVVKGKEMVEESDLSKLIYLKLVVKEALRLHPPVPLLVPRETTETCMIKAYEIPPKTRVFINVKSIARDPKCWENRNEFVPERFLNSAIDYRGQHFQLLPFGTGRRGCPGINFAMPQVELTLANLLYLFDWGLPHGLKREALDMEEASGITVQKKAPLRLIALPFPT